MAWGWFGRGRGGWAGPWPGRGPFSYLPPWQRPGWWFGRGAYWWLLAPYIWSQYGYPSYYGYPPFRYQAYGPYSPPLGYPAYAPWPYLGYLATAQQYRFPPLWW